MEKINKSKQKILNSAEKLFSEKGYDATSIDDITKLAGTTKALFFYYFEKKTEILHILMQNKINEAVNEFIEKKQTGIISDDKEEIFRYSEEFINKNYNIAKIALFEFLKTPNNTNFIMDLPKNIFSKVSDLYEFTTEDEIKFIMNTIRTIVVYTIKDSLCKKYNVSSDYIEKIDHNLLQEWLK